MDKFEFLKSNIKYLGFLISENGIRADDKGIEAVKEFSVISKVQAVQSFLGLSSYFRRSIKDFSKIAKPLYGLLRKDKPFQIGGEAMNCFLRLKEKLLKSPILVLYNYKDDAELHCAARIWCRTFTK